MTSTRFAMIVALLAAPLAVSCGGGNNNGNGNPQCSDGIDNDGDGLIDFPADPGCTSASDDSEDSPTSPQCSDGRDNDGDGKTDYPDDPGCSTPNGDSEVDDCPSGPNCPQCSNGIDDDGNGLTDYPNDPGCTSAADTTEATTDAAACGGSVTVMPMPPSMDVTGTLTGNSNLQGSCGGAGPEAVYQLNLPTAKVVVASTDNGNTAAATVVYFRGSNCTDASTEVGCAQPGSNGASNGNGAIATASLAAGTWFVVVDGATSISSGAFELMVTEYPGAGTPCTVAGDGECAPGLTCRTTGSGSDLTCEPHECSDGIDNDNDGKIDYPNDPGCATPDGDSEVDDCPSGPNCPQCSNGIDDDHDGDTDYPNDTSCKSAAGTSESCNVSTPVTSITMATTMGDDTNGGNDFEPSCTDEPGEPDVTFELDLPATKTLTITVSDPSFNTFPAAVLYGASCGGSEIDCEEDPEDVPISETDLPASTYYLVVDADFDGGTGPFEITVSGTIGSGQSCESPLAQVGALTCEAGYACKGSVGSRTCAVAECNDGSDNDNDGKTDYPLDPGCSSISDDDETDDCPSGPNCPACSNGIDDDNDGHTDYPADTSCVSAGDVSEACTETDGVLAMTTPTITGDTTNAHDDFEPTCAEDTGGQDLTYELQLPGLATFSASVDTGDEWFAAVELLNSTCGGTAVKCNDDDPATVTKNNLAAGTYYVVVDGDLDFYYGPFTLTITGTIASGQSCTSPLYTSGALTCVTGTTCSGGTCH